MDATDPPAPQRRWWLHIFATFLALLLLYVLSIGPVGGYFVYRLGHVQALDEHVRVQEQSNRVRALYLPVFSLVQKVGWEDSLLAYIGWWSAMYIRFSGKGAALSD
jgi:hypothetical protein